MSVKELEHCSKDELIEELINRQTFVGLVIFHRGEAKAGRLDPGEIVMTKSPPLSREGVETLLQVGQSLVPGMFGEKAATAGEELPLRAYAPPLRVDEGRTVRVGNSRISLDVVVEQYENGMTPEEMVRAYDSLALAEVYAVIAYYCRYQNEVRAYLKRQEEEAGALRAKIEGEHPHVSREELLARGSAREKANAPTGQ